VSRSPEHLEEWLRFYRGVISNELAAFLASPAKRTHKELVGARELPMTVDAKNLEATLRNHRSRTLRVR
jgi:hypothetical protein